MHGEQDRAEISRAYAEHRPYLIDLAFRMLGDIGAAEDTVQDAFWRLMHADLEEIADERGWLIVVTSRLCLDRIRSARSRRERAHDASEIEFTGPAVGAAPPPLADPADRVTFDDGVRLALLAMLQRLSPAERVVFVLHDVFQLPFAEVARTVGRPSRPAASWPGAPGRRSPGPAARFDVAATEHRLVTEKFIAACATGDLGGLLGVLAPDAWGEVDLGPDARLAPGVVTGAVPVAGNLLRFWGAGVTLVSHPVGGQPAVLAFRRRALAGLIVFTMRGELIQAVQVIADPRQLGFVSAQLPAPR